MIFIPFLILFYLKKEYHEKPMYNHNSNEMSDSCRERPNTVYIKRKKHSFWVIAPNKLLTSSHFVFIYTFSYIFH
ncbi:hypothetical protein AAV22_15360 [Listeria monocytogenes]|nr:hypothetical protein [Listeria monocytogenes]